MFKLQNKLSYRVFAFGDRGGKLKGGLINLARLRFAQDERPLWFPLPRLIRLFNFFRVIAFHSVFILREAFFCNGGPRPAHKVQKIGEVMQRV